ncbi:GlxA family transcriptional regulator [Arhodomonas sp. AD133]|uniref:GlxA family transcriptional regulator n=1 Tax=Arhodomonas sp. AD133 TaxID=3415009 RepID=UPI003EB6E779
MRIGLLLYPGCMPAGLFAFADLLHATNRRVGARLFETRYVGLEPGTVTCAHAVPLEISSTLEAADTDAVLVPGFWAESASQVAETVAENAGLIEALASRTGGGALWSYCTGVCLLAASGRLDGRTATVTWWLADAMLRDHPTVDWRTERDCVFDAESATASGVHGYLPIGRTVIERRVNPTVFHDLINLMVLPRPVQPHSAFRAMSIIEQPHGLLRQLHAVVEGLAAERVTVQRLAAALGTSTRTLARRVSDETGLTPADYARRVKLNQVSERLILTTKPVTTISAELGFSSESNLTRAFKRVTGLTPLAYRQTFGRT